MSAGKGTCAPVSIQHSTCEATEKRVGQAETKYFGAATYINVFGNGPTTSLENESFITLMVLQSVHLSNVSPQTIIVKHFHAINEILRISLRSTDLHLVFWDDRCKKCVPPSFNNLNQCSVSLPSPAPLPRPSSKIPTLPPFQRNCLLF